MRQSCRNLQLFQRGKGDGQGICDFGKGVCAHIFETDCHSKGIDTSVNGLSPFQVWETARNWVHKVFLKISIQEPVLPVFPEHKILILVFALNSFQGVLKDSDYSGS